MSPFDSTRTLGASDGNYMVIGGIRYPVIDSEIQSGRGELRMLWRIVTEGQEQEEEGEPIFKMRTGYDDVLFDKYGLFGEK